jgi:hypothetical protein
MSLFNPLGHEIYLNNIYKFNSYPTKNNLYALQDQLINTVQRYNRCLFQVSYETQTE